MTETKYESFYSMAGLCGYKIRILTNEEDNYDVDERVEYVFVGTEKPHKPQKAIIRYTMKGRAYFLANGRRIHLDECDNII